MMGCIRRWFAGEPHPIERYLDAIREDLSASRPEPRVVIDDAARALLVECDTVPMLIADNPATPGGSMTAPKWSIAYLRGGGTICAWLGQEDYRRHQAGDARVFATADQESRYLFGRLDEAAALALKMQRENDCLYAVVPVQA